jgi:peptidoglycan/LPS O-acetylase OafA/YrhL
MGDAAGGAASSASTPPRGAAGGRGPHAPGAVGRGSRAADATAGRGSRAADATTGRGSRAKPPRAAQLPYLFVLAVTIGALAWIWQGGIQHAKEGTLALAGAMFIGALARLVLPKPRAGMLASRRRLVDVVCLAALAVGLLVAGLVLPIPS